MPDNQKDQNLTNYIFLLGAVIILLILTYYIFRVASVYFSSK